MLSYTESLIEKLMTRKLGKTYDKYATSKNRNKILLRKLKEVLTGEVNDMLKRNGMLSPPFDPFKIKKIGRSKILVVYTSRSDISADGSIDTCDDGFLIRIDKALIGDRKGLRRLRSTMAHELMHTFFYDVDELPPARRGFRALSRKQLLMEEELCSYLTRCFLIPTFSICNFLKNGKFVHPSLTNIECLKSTFLTSSDIVAYRMISDLSIWNAVFIKFLRTGTVYKSKTKLKSKANKLYKKVKIPYQVPFETTRAWSAILSDHVLEAARKGLCEEIVKLDECSLALESKQETINPISIITLAYQVD